MNRVHRKLASRPNLSKNSSQRSQPLKNEAISKVLEKMEEEELRVARPTAAVRVALPPKQKSSKEMAIKELTQLHDLYFGRYQQSEKERLQVGTGQAAREGGAEAPAALQQKKPKYEVQPPQIMHKPSSNDATNAAQRLQQS